MIRIALVDDHILVRNGIKMLLDTDDGIAVVAEFESGKDVLSFLRESPDSCDIVITDINMAEMDGFALGLELQKDFPAVKIVLLSMLNDLSYILKAFNTGVSGFLLKSVDYEELLFAVHHIHRGGKYLCDELCQQLIDHLNQKPDFALKKEELISDIKINERELEVLALISDGFTNQEIADQLFLGKRTIEGLRQSLIAKTGTKNSASLVKFALLHGFID